MLRGGKSGQRRALHHLTGGIPTQVGSQIVSQKITAIRFRIAECGFRIIEDCFNQNKRKALKKSGVTSQSAIQNPQSAIEW
jgi:hypothetical protein